MERTSRKELDTEQEWEKVSTFPLPGIKRPQQRLLNITLDLDQRSEVKRSKNEASWAS